MGGCCCCPPCSPSQGHLYRQGESAWHGQPFLGGSSPPCTFSNAKCGEGESPYPFLCLASPPAELPVSCGGEAGSLAGRKGGSAGWRQGGSFVVQCGGVEQEGGRRRGLHWGGTVVGPFQACKEAGRGLGLELLAGCSGAGGWQVPLCGEGTREVLHRHGLGGVTAHECKGRRLGGLHGGGAAPLGGGGRRRAGGFAGRGTVRVAHGAAHTHTRARRLLPAPAALLQRE